MRVLNFFGKVDFDLQTPQHHELSEEVIVISLHLRILEFDELFRKLLSLLLILFSFCLELRLNLDQLPPNLSFPAVVVTLILFCIRL